MGATAEFRTTMLSGRPLAGTFVRTPSHLVIETLALSGLDFACLDTEHAPFDRAGLDACLAVARALDFPVLVRVPSAAPQPILQALDAGAVGIVVPHVDSPGIAADAARAAHFGAGGRSFAGFTRWAGTGKRTMAEVLAQDAETAVIVQIEEPAGVAAAEAIAATGGVDGVFLGPADLSVAMGKTDMSSPELEEAAATVGAAARAAGKAYLGYVSSADQAAAWHGHGMSVFFVGTEHDWISAGATAAAGAIHALPR